MATATREVHGKATTSSSSSQNEYLQRTPLARQITVTSNWLTKRPQTFRVLILVFIGLIILSKSIFLLVGPTNSDNYVSAFEVKPRMVAFLPDIARINLNDFSETTITTASDGSNTPDQKLKGAKTNTNTKSGGNIFKWTWDHITVDFIGKDYEDFQKLLSDSEDAKERMLDPPPDGCVPQHDWQTQSFPTCNILHEQSLLEQTKKRDDRLLLGQGAYRSVWSLLLFNEEPFALKMLNYDHDMTERRIERHRLDALIAERLTASPYVLDVFAYCANSAVYTFARQSLENLMEQGQLYKWSSHQKLKVAFQVAAAVADLHNIDHDDKASFLHGDIDASQFVTTAAINAAEDEDEVIFQLNDFNGGRLLYVDEQNKNNDGDPTTIFCPVTPSLYGGRHRSPEDYNFQRVTEKSDIYSLGNVLYAILTGRFPLSQFECEDAQKLIRQNSRDKLPSNMANDPYIQAIMEAIELAWEQYTFRRAPARKIAALLQHAMFHQDEELSR